MLDLLKQKEKAYLLGTGVGMACALIFIGINLLRDMPALALGNLALLLGLALNMGLYLRHRALIPAVLVGLALDLTFVLFAAEHIGVRAFFWLYVLPWVAFFFLRLRGGLLVCLAIPLIVFLWQAFRPVPHSVLPGPEMDLLLSLLFVGLLNYLYEYLRETHRLELERLVTTDPLTQIINRIGFQQYLEHAIAAARRSGDPLALITFDVDHFKQINDTYGHPAGDATLIELARLAGETIRRSDVLGRWGGEEFQVLAVQTGLEGARVLAEKLRVAIEARPFGSVARVTISAGVTALRSQDSLEGLLKRADVALYRAKNGGRNRVEVEP